MRAYFNLAEFALEEALISLLNERLAEKLLTIGSTDNKNELETPSVFVNIHQAMEPEELHGTATEEVTIGVGISTDTGASRDKHVQAVGMLNDLIFSDDFITDLNAGRSEGLVVQRVRRRERTTRVDTDGKTRKTEQVLEVLCSMDG